MWSDCCYSPLVPYWSIMFITETLVQTQTIILTSTPLPVLLNDIPMIGRSANEESLPSSVVI